MRVFTRAQTLIRFAAVVAGCAVCAACGSAASGGHQARGAGAGFPVTVGAANGKVHLAKRPHAIISLSPSATEMLYAIGAGSQVKAVDSDSDYPPQAPRTALSGFQPSVEAIIGYKPDLVVVDGTAGGLVQRLTSLSIPVLELPAPPTLNGVYSEFDQLGQATGHLAQARHEDALLRSQIGAIVAASAHHRRPLTYYYELDQTYYSITSDTFVGRLLGLLGLKSIADAGHGAAAAGGYPQLSSEFIVKANPAYIILADTVCCHQSAATVSKRPGWSNIAAVKAGHVIALNDDIASRWGPRLVTLLRDVAAGLASSQPG
ncbi:MAG TPA: ABC transporter substrate-binding protein [Streptosporangiaceae bacterium]|nr:ABC transporter substrate-binding protein [Streptosporangiaceae bacterium]